MPISKPLLGILSSRNSATISVEYLVIAGGGGGGCNGGGGGAGGYKTATGFLISPGINYTVTIGDGGAGGLTSGIASGSDGNDSVFSTIISTKGAGGGGGNAS